LTKEYNFIIVGQGLAGTCLASALLDRGKSVIIFDSPKLPSSSMVAGGLFNPITGRNMVLTWKANLLFPFLQKFYRDLEKKLGQRFIFNLPLFRPFISTEELNMWHGRSTEDQYTPFVEFVDDRPFHPQYVNNEQGGVLLRQTGYLNTTGLLEYFRSFLQEKEILVEDEFLPQNINFNGSSVVYKEYLASKIILCDGPTGFGNRWLEDIRFHPLKGEVLHLNIDYDSNFILNRNAFVLPREGSFIAGSNYDLTGKDWQTTTEAREEIVTKIDKILNIDYEITGQRAGLRPTTHDRRPVVGLLPKRTQIGIFNGLGTKGVSLAPYFANQFANFLTKGGKIDMEVQIGRFFK
jgi:glycine oxidase